MLERLGVHEENRREALAKVPGFAISESQPTLRSGVAALAASVEAERWSGRIVTARQLADAYNVTHTDGSRPDCWGCIRYGIEEQSGKGVEDYP